MRVLVTGATGFLGGYVVDELRSHGHEVCAAVRAGSDTTRLERAGISRRAFDLGRPEGMADAVRGMDCVVHLAAYYTFSGRKELYRKLNVEATEALVRACRAEGVGHLVYCSSTEAIGPVQGIGDEESELRPQYEYGRSKVEAERKVRELAEPMAWTVLRPSGIYGPGNVDDVSYWTIVTYGQGRVTRYLIGSGQNLIQFVHAKDVASAFRLALEKRSAAQGRTYIVSDSRAYTYEEVYRLLSELKGVPPPQGHLPSWLAKTLVVPVQAFDRVRGRDSFLMRTSTIDALTTDRAYRIDRARKELEYEPGYDLRTGLAETIDWYRRNGFL